MEMKINKRRREQISLKKRVEKLKEKRRKKGGRRSDTTYVRPNSGNFSLSAATNFERIWC